MPLTNVDYSKTIIYKIQHKEIDELLYVGSTTDFTRRKATHKWRCNNNNDKCPPNLKVYKMMRDNGGWDMFNMVIIKEFPCNNKQEALAEEDRCIRETKATLNMMRAYISHDEKAERCKHYMHTNYERNKPKILERCKQYRELHKEQCAKYRKQHYEQNKEYILERGKHYYEQNKEKVLEHCKQYRDLHKEQYAKTNKIYREKNKDKKKNNDKQYYEQNKEYILERMKQKITCECGCIITKCNLKRHFKSMKHQDFLNNQ